MAEVTLAPDEVTARALTAGGKQIPQAIAKLMIDSGAQLTCVDHAIADAIGLRPIRFTPVTGVSGVSEDYPVYRMGIILGMSDASGSSMQMTYSADVVGMPSPKQTAMHSGLLGRDFLRHFRFIYDGSSGEFELRLAASFSGIQSGLPQATPAAPSTAHGQNHSHADRKARRKRERDARRKNR